MRERFGNAWTALTAGRIEDLNRLRLGALAIGALILVTVLVVGFGRLGVGKSMYHAEFAQAAQLRSGDQVTAAGVPIGTVESVRLDGDRVLVGMKIDDDVALGERTEAAIKLTTLLGSRYVEISPAGDGEIPERRIPLAQTTVPYDLQTALQNATTTFERVDAERIGKSMTLLSEQLDGAPELMPQAIANIEALSSVIADRREQVGQLLTSTAELTTAVREQQVSLGQMVIQGRNVIDELVRRIITLRALMTSTTSLIDSLHSVLADHRPQIAALLEDLEVLLGSVARREDVLRNTLQVMPLPVRNFANATGNGNNLEFSSPAANFVDSWMCAVSGQAEMMSLAKYFEDCK